MKWVKQASAFIDASPSPFHAVQNCIDHLVSAGFTEIQESQAWNLKASGMYFYTRNKSAIVAFTIGAKYVQGNGFCIVGAHTDSPCLKVKPCSHKEKFGYVQVGVELYGGAIWHSWFDRDLGLAGRVFVEKEGVFEHRLVNIHKPILRIPTLAIHLERGANDSFTFNNETQLTPILSQVTSDALNKKDAESAHGSVLMGLLADELHVPASQIRDFELCLFDVQRAAVGGAKDEFLHSARLDNLMMSFCALTALTESTNSLSNDQHIRVVGLFDNEEVGSTTAHGANSNFLEVSLKRLADLPIGVDCPEVPFLDSTKYEDWTLIHVDQKAAFERCLSNSVLVSADMAHALHPNYSDKHEENHRPKINGGVVIKQNANQRYATTSFTTLMLREAAKMTTPPVPLQEFVVRNDSPCGSTIGPMLSAKLGIKTVDVGNPQWSMHSIRETCGTSDVAFAVDLFKSLFEGYASILARMPKL